MRFDEINEKGPEPEYDLKGRYQHYNNMLFDGQLPDIPVTFYPLKGKGGSAKCKLEVDPTAPPRSPAWIRARRLRYYGYRPKKGTLRIQIASTFKRTNEALDGILIHEMIHIYFYSIDDLEEGHGSKFMRMLSILSAKVGFQIPRKDDTDDAEVATVKPVLVFVRYVNRKPYSFAIMAQSFLKDVRAFRLMAVPFLSYASTDGIEAVIMKTPEWTKIAHGLPAQRNLKKLYAVNEHVPSFENPAQVVFEIHAKPDAPEV